MRLMEVVHPIIPSGELFDTASDEKSLLLREQHGNRCLLIIDSQHPGIVELMEVLELNAPSIQQVG